jgi:hypothetical protein
MITHYFVSCTLNLYSIIEQPLIINQFSFVIIQSSIFITTMIKLNNIFKWYSSGFVKTFVLRDVSLDIAQGNLYLLWGPPALANPVY